MLNGRTTLAKAVVNAGCTFVGADVDRSRINRIVEELSSSADVSSSADLERV